MLGEWDVELYEDSAGRCSTATFLRKLRRKHPTRHAAALTALEVVLPFGLSVLADRNEWVAPLKGGLYEFRIRHTSEEMLHAWRGDPPRKAKPPDAVLLRFFVAERGNQILVLSGYDKQKNSALNYQNSEIQKARSMLKDSDTRVKP